MRAIAATKTDSSRDHAADVLELVLRYRRVAPDSKACANPRCPRCIAPHIDRVVHATSRNEPITFVLPGFPGKSPNPAKVLGTRPDMAERQSLAFLNALCRQIEELYAPGARIVLCSDGRVFSDVVGIQDDAITEYQRDLGELIVELRADRLATFNLDDVFGGLGFAAMRARLLADFSESTAALQDAVRASGEAQRMYRGITRFLFEDAVRPDMTISKTALQKECRQRAYQVMRRSKAWDALVARYFPNAVRLSIHPQDCGSRKIGIHLLETRDAWLTPWHCVAVETQGRFWLMKRAQAETIKAELVYRNGRPSHYMVATPPEAARQQ